MKQDTTTRDGYLSFSELAQSHPALTYGQIDELILRRVNLFAPAEGCDLDALSAVCDRILEALPAIKRIFAAPITHLKDTAEILPVEAVRLVNNRTVVHAMSHSQLWADITEDGPRPRKLMTLNYHDDYAIYENIAFVHAMRVILRFTAESIRRLQNMLYPDSGMTLDPMDRRHHASYLTALGKLRLGYLRDCDRHLATAKKHLDTLRYIDRTIRAGASTPLWRSCVARADKVKLKKTNIFRLHKDYHRIYVLLKWLEDSPLTVSSPLETAASREGYRVFCTLLTVFAAAHFNFTFDDAPISLLAPNATARFGGWHLRIDTHADTLRLQVTKEKTHTVLLPPSPDGTPENAPPLSQHDLHSFLHVQSLLLRSMLLADTQKALCPFCASPLSPSCSAHLPQCDDGLGGESHDFGVGS